MTSRDSADPDQPVYRPVLVPEQHTDRVEQLIHDLELADADAGGDSE